jgi:hypothetical protein
MLGQTAGRRQPCLLDEPLGDLLRRASAERGDSGDRHHLLDRGARGPGVALDKRGEKRRAAAIAGFRRLKRLGEAVGPAEPGAQPARPRLRQFEGGDESHHEPRIAEPDGGVRHAERLHRLQREGDHIGVSRFAVLVAEALDAGLQELTRSGVASIAEDRPGVAVAGGQRRGRRQMIPADRNCVVGPETELAAVGILHEIEPAADVLAGQVEEGVGRLYDRRLGALEPARGKQRVQRVARSRG